jgi:pyruvyltransferase
MISLAFSTRKIDQNFVDMLVKTSGIKNLEVLPFENNGEYSLTQVYNMALEKSTNDLLILCHDDIYFEKNYWGQKIIKHFEKNPEYGILGVAGSTKLPKSAMWWEDRTKMKGIVNHESNGKKWESKYSNNLGNKLDDVVLVDGLFIVINKKKIKTNFNEDIKGFHFYDVDFSFRNFIKGVKIGVFYDVRITHKSIGMTNESWEENRRNFSQNYKEQLPIKVFQKLTIDSPLKVMISCLFFKDYTGSEMYVYELAKSLRKLNCDVTVVSDINGPLSRNAKTYGIKTLPFSDYPGYKLGDGQWMMNTPQGPQVSQPNRFYKISEVDYDIIHIQHKPVTERVVQMYPNIPKVSTIHSEVISLEDPIIDGTILNYITIRPEIQDKIVNIDGIDINKTQVVYNPIDENRFNLKNTKDDGYILFVGTVDYLREKSLIDISEYAKSVGKELWIVGENKSNYLDILTSQSHVKYYSATNQVEKYVKNCSETAGILLGRTTIEGWLCGKPGWIYQIDSNGNITSKEKHDVPSDVSKFISLEVAKKIKQIYIDSINKWNETDEDIVIEKRQSEMITADDLYFNGRKITPNNTKNWGDLVPAYIIQKLSGSDKLKDEDVFNVKSPAMYYPIYSTGSVMHFTKRNSIVWGTGCIDKNSVGQIPSKIYAVRGPLTREELLKKGWDCPEVYGDPALLFPKIYNPKVEKKYKYGIIPHYIEYESKKDINVIKNLESLGFKVIDICAGIEKFIDELLEVEYVVSSSLHGLIVSDAYGIPNARVNISNKLIGGHFKFMDYCQSVGREMDYGLQLTEYTELSDIEELHFNHNINFDSDKLLSSGPWNFEENNDLFFSKSLSINE